MSEIDETSRRLFRQLLRMARRIREFDHSTKHSILIGMWLVMKDNRADFTIADNMRDYQRHIASGAEVFGE